MPTNKNALARIAILDELLANRHHYYNLDDLTEICNERLEDIGVSTVTRQCIEKDIDFIEGASFQKITWNPNPFTVRKSRLQTMKICAVNIQNSLVEGFSPLIVFLTAN